jgi:hypothetical protein
MTLILGINLTDSVYLAADTRVTKMKGNQITGSHDNLLKIWGNQEGVFCAVAGDAGLAKYLLIGLQDQDFSRRGIESVRENIEQYIYETADSYWRKKGCTTDATLMFAGNSKHKRAYIEVDDAQELVAAHKNNKEARSELGSTKFMLYSNIASRPTKQYRTNFNRTDLFAVQITTQEIIITDSKPGQHLVYGSPGLVKEDVELKEVARIEFGDSNNNPMLITAYINGMREKRDLKGVSSTVVPIHIQPDGSSILVTGTTYSVRIDDEGVPIPEEISSIEADPATGKFYRLQKGNRTELVPITRYGTNDADGMTLL